MKRKAVLWVIMALALPWASQVSASSLDTFGASSRGTAMGGAMVSIANGWESVYYNPSALGLSRDSTAVEVYMLSGGLDINGVSSMGGGVSAKFAINHRFLRDRVGLGLLVGLSPAGLSGGLDPTSLLSFGGGSGGWSMYQDSLPIVYDVGLGFRVTDWLAVGVSTSQKHSLVSMGFYPLVIDPLLQGLIGISTGVIPSDVKGTSFSYGSYDGTEVAVAYNMTLRLSKYLSVGYVYRPETTTRIKLRLEMVGGGGSLLTKSRFMLYDITMPNGPETTIYGVAGHIPIKANNGTLTIAWQREQQNWAGFYQQTINYSWEGGDVFAESWFDNNTNPPLLEDVAFDRFGFEYDGSATPLLFWRLKQLSNARFAVRGGYYHWNSPQQDVTRSSELAMVDSDADVYSFGLGFGYDRRKKVAVEGVPPRLEIDLHFQQTVLEDRNYIFQPDDFGNTGLGLNYMNTSGSLTQYGLQITWWQ